MKLSLILGVYVILYFVLGSDHFVSGCGLFISRDGSMYNINALMKTPGSSPYTNTNFYSFVEEDFGEGKPYTYYWNFCEDVSSVCGFFPADNSLRVAQVSTTGTCMPLGYGEASILSHPSGPKSGFVVQYLNTRDSKCIGSSVTETRTVDIIVSCGSSEEVVRVAEPGGYGSCYYKIEMTSPNGCPIDETSERRLYKIEMTSPHGRPVGETGESRVFNQSSIEDGRNTTIQFPPIGFFNQSSTEDGRNTTIQFPLAGFFGFLLFTGIFFFSLGLLIMWLINIQWI